MEKNNPVQSHNKHLALELNSFSEALGYHQGTKQITAPKKSCFHLKQNYFKFNYMF